MIWNPTINDQNLTFFDLDPKFMTLCDPEIPWNFFSYMWNFTSTPINRSCVVESNFWPRIQTYWLEFSSIRIQTYPFYKRTLRIPLYGPRPGNHFLRFLRKYNFALWDIDILRNFLALIFGKRLLMNVQLYQIEEF